MEGHSARTSAISTPCCVVLTVVSLVTFQVLVKRIPNFFFQLLLLGEQGIHRRVEVVGLGVKLLDETVHSSEPKLRSLRGRLWGGFNWRLRVCVVGIND